MPSLVRTVFLMRFNRSCGFKRECRVAAFSLIEVTLALGILSFAGVAIFALLPVALTSLQTSSFDTIVTQIATDARADLQQVELVGSGQKVSYYDSNGQQVSRGESVYTAYRSETPQLMPGATTGSLRRVSLQVVYNPGRVALTVDGNGWATIPENFQSRTLRFFVVR